MRGSHCLKTWSKTQAIVAKSSAEAELYAVVRGATEGSGIAILLSDFGVALRIEVNIDAAAAKGIIELRGLQKLRHIDLDVLWLLEQKARRLLPVDTIQGTDNISDLMTKNLAGPTIDKYIPMMNLNFAEGRSAIAQNLHSIGLNMIIGRKGRPEIRQ